MTRLRPGTSEPHDPTRRESASGRVLLWGTRVGAYAAAFAGWYWFGTLYSGVFEDGIWPVLICYAIAGALIGLRALPTGRAFDRVLTEGFDPVMKPRMRVSGIDLAIVLGIALLGGLLSSPDNWGFPIVMSLALVIALAVGVMVGLLVLMPFGLLAQVGSQALSGRKVALGVAGVALLLLEVVAFAVLTGFAIEDPVGGRGRAWVGIFVVLTGRSIDEAHVVSEPLAWVARAVALLIALTVLFVVVQQRRTRRDRDA